MALRDDDLTGDEAIVQEAKDRFKKCLDWEADFRRLYLMDVKFANGDADNGWQWPDDLRKDREKNRRPALTINKTAQYVAQIVNDMRQNECSISIKPMGQEASFDAAQILEGLMRHIEYISSAQNIYDEATESQVEGGIGYWRVIQQYTDDQTFDQELLIAPVRDTLSVILDCDIKQKDGSDARYGFVFDDIPEKEFERQYPGVDIKDVSGTGTGLNEQDDWVRDGNIRIAEYYRILEKRDKLIHLEDEQGQAAEFKRSEIPDKYRKRFEELGENVKDRDITTKQLEWYKIAGAKIIDQRKLKGKYIPLIRLIGKERVIEGRLERKGHVRALKDPQRMYNYNSSGQVEYGAMGTKTQWMVATDAISGNEVAWNNMNRDNAAYVTFKHRDEDGNEIPPPQRIEPPGTVPAFLDGMKIAAAEMELASGQQASQQQNPAVERTPAAINAREKKGEVATSHYTMNRSIALRHTGRILLDLIPYIYDTERVIQILGKDGSQTKVKVQPDLKEAMQIQSERDQVTEVLFNPKVGKYEVESDVGPAYASQRQEAWNAFVQITANNAELVSEIGDLMFQSADFPLADEISERFKRKIRATMPWLLDETPGPVIAELQKQIQTLSGQLADSLQELAEKKIAIKGKDEKRDIEVYRAKTDRLVGEGNTVSNLAELGGDNAEFKRLIRQTIAQMMGLSLSPVTEANAEELHSYDQDIPEPTAQ